MVNIHLLMKRKGAIAEFFFEPIDQQVILSFVSHLRKFFIKPDKKTGLIKRVFLELQDPLIFRNSVQFQTLSNYSMGS